MRVAAGRDRSLKLLEHVGVSSCFMISSDRPEVCDPCRLLGYMYYCLVLYMERKK